MGVVIAGWEACGRKPPVNLIAECVLERSLFLWGINLPLSLFLTRGAASHLRRQLHGRPVRHAPCQWEDGPMIVQIKRVEGVTRAVNLDRTVVSGLLSRRIARPLLAGPQIIVSLVLGSRQEPGGAISVIAPPLSLIGGLVMRFAVVLTGYAFTEQVQANSEYRRLDR